MNFIFAYIRMKITFNIFSVRLGKVAQWKFIKMWILKILTQHLNHHICIFFHIFSHLSHLFEWVEYRINSVIWWLYQINQKQQIYPCRLLCGCCLPSEGLLVAPVKRIQRKRTKTILCDSSSITNSKRVMLNFHLTFDTQISCI